MAFVPSSPPLPVFGGAQPAAVVADCRMHTLPSASTICSRQHLTDTEEEGSEKTVQGLTEESNRSPNGTIIRARMRPSSRRSCSRMARQLCALRRPMLTILTPLLLLPLLLSQNLEYKCAFCAILMAVYWISEVMPLPVTALLPAVLFPVTGILGAREVAHEYLNDTNFLFVGGLIMAAAVEKCGLHERVALGVLSTVGSEPRRLLLGFMTITALLSMFISNTATVAMMLPIGQSLIVQFAATSRRKKPKGESQAVLIEAAIASDEESGDRAEQQHIVLDATSTSQCRTAKGLILGITFAANVGGVGTLTGTSPNLVLVGMLAALFPGAETGVNYLSWTALTVPLLCCSLLACWLILSLIFLRGTSAPDASVGQMMRRKSEEMPPMSFAQKSVCACFALLLLLWIGREPGFVPGVGSLFAKGFYSDATSAVAVGILLFLLPAENPFTEHDSKPAKGQRGNGTGETLMDWQTMQKQFPWGISLLLGGGFALAAGVRESGLSELMANALGQLEAQPDWALQLICILVIMFVTNICSNAVTASIFIPIVASIAQRAQMHPLALMLPTTLSCSFAFVLPVGTPGNAIAFSTGLLRVSDMMLAGFCVSVSTALLMVGHLRWVAPLLVPIDRFPVWAALLSNGTGAEEVQEMLENVAQLAI